MMDAKPGGQLGTQKISSENVKQDSEVQTQKAFPVASFWEKQPGEALMGSEPSFPALGDRALSRAEEPKA